MKKTCTLQKHLSPEELEKRYKACANTREARRWHCLLLVSKGFYIYQAARLVCLSGPAALDLLDRYNQRGPEAVSDGRSKSQHGRGRTPALTPAQFEELAEVVNKEPKEWKGSKVVAWIKEKTGHEHHPQLGCEYLKKIRQALPTK